MGFYYFNYNYFLFMLPAIILSLAAQIAVNSTFKKYSRVNTQRGMTGMAAAEAVLRLNGVSGVRFQRISGNLTDNFNPQINTISLSDAVGGVSTVSAVGVAAHEAGHAVQHAQDYLPNKIRTALVPVTNIGSNLAIPLVLVGLLLPVQYDFVAYIGIALYSLVFLFQLATLPVEFNASARAIRALDGAGVLTQEELGGAKKVLTAAAMTYVAAMFASLLSLLRLLLIVGSRRGRN